MLLSDRQMIKGFQDTVNDLDWRIRSIRVLRDPHLEEAAALQLEENILNMFLPEQLRNLLNHFESVDGLLFGLDSLDISETCLVHPLHQAEGHGLGLLLEIFVTFQSLLSAISGELMTTAKLGEELTSLLLGVCQLEGGVLLGLDDLVRCR
jgi:hypothetical protein